MTHAERLHYELCLAQGCSERLAEMFALGQPPMSNTDREFLEGTENGRQFEGQEEVGDYYLGLAREAGVDPKGKVYKSGLAAFPGDPQAWVSGRGDVRKLCEERGWECDGAVKVKMTKVAEPTGGGLAPDIVEREVQAVLDTVENPREIDVNDLREQVIEKCGPYWAKP